MPALTLFVRSERLLQNKGTPDEIEFPNGVLPLDPPLQSPELVRVLSPRLYAMLRCAPIPGAFDVILDTGAPLTLFPRSLWRDTFRWQEGRHFETCQIAGLGPFVASQLLGSSFRARIVRLMVPVELAGRDGDRLRVERLIAQLAEPATAKDDPKFTVLGLWGGVFEGRRLAVARLPNSDALAARLEW